MTAAGRRRQRGTIRRLPSGRWQARIRHTRTGKLIPLGTFRTRREADDAIAQAAVSQARGDFVSRAQGRKTVHELADEWLPTKQHLRPSTLALYRYLLENLVLPDLGAMRLDRLDARAVRAWRSDLLARPTLSEATVAKAYRLLRQILDLAVEARYVVTNPATIKGAATEPEPTLRIPTLDEAVALVAAMPENLQTLILLAGFTGLRLGEVQALRRRHVDLPKLTVRVEEAIAEPAGQLIVGPPKTHAGARTVDIPDFVAAALEDHLERFSTEGPDGLVFPAPRGGYLRRAKIYPHWRAAREAVGCPEVRIHDLRHLAGTLGTLTGATTKEQMARLGHSTPRAALRYQHVVEGRGRAIASAIDAMFKASQGPTPPDE